MEDGRQTYDLIATASGAGALTGPQKALGLTAPLRCRLGFHPIAGFKPGASLRNPFMTGELYATFARTPARRHLGAERPRRRHDDRTGTYRTDGPGHQRRPSIGPTALAAGCDIAAAPFPPALTSDTRFLKRGYLIKGRARTPMAAQAPALITPLDLSSLKAVVEGHARYLTGLPGGRRASLAYTDLRNCVLENADLREADFTGALLSGALMAGVKLGRATLFGCDLRNADLRNADLTKADLRGACLRGANLSMATLSGCDLREGTIALQDPKGGFHILKHEKRAGELSYAILTGAHAGETRR